MPNLPGFPFRSVVLDQSGKITGEIKKWFDVLVGKVNQPLTSQTFDSLPPAPQIGAFAVISDSTTETWGAVVAGGGGFTVLVWFGASGTWTVYGKS